MATFNTISPRQKINDPNYRGSYTADLTDNQFKSIHNLASELEIELIDVWDEFFDKPYKSGNWRSISLNAASEVIGFLLRIKVAEKLEQSFLAKIQRTEQQQHEWEMYPDGKL